ncbi:hypothetical protein D3C71_1559220 [compost metagenome]
MGQRGVGAGAGEVGQHGVGFQRTRVGRAEESVGGHVAAVGVEQFAYVLAAKLVALERNGGAAGVLALTGVPVLAAAGGDFDNEAVVVVDHGGARGRC